MSLSIKPTSRRKNIELEEAGTFTIGCNYWASHAGTAMWSNWQPEVVARDLAQLHSCGVRWLRIFPLWSDFQPIHLLRGCAGSPVEIRLGENPLPDGELGQAGISSVMMERFLAFAQIAQDAGLKLIVGLITGWMSGRLFVPPALEGLDPITKPLSLTWQIRFVRAFINHCSGLSSIVSWDLGNECNCMGSAPSPESAYLWTAAIANAIRSADTSRPIISGMHSLTSSTGGTGNVWHIEHQAELTDILTTHPYPYWTRHMRSDAVNTLRTTFHATAETSFYRDIGGKPCFAEEIGTMGPMVASDSSSAVFARTNLFSLWANDARGFFWWCAYDQTSLGHAPYDWNGVELELGLLRADGALKPVAGEMVSFQHFLDNLPFARLPSKLTDGICLLTHGQDDWAVAFGAFVLAKQAKLELRFAQIQQTIPEAPLYFLPSLTGPNCVPQRKWKELLDRVRRGATLYLSLEDGILPFFCETTGAELVSRAKPSKPLFANLDGVSFPLWDGDDLVFAARSIEILASREDTGTPAFWKHSLGEGQIYVFISPVEKAMTLRPGAFAPDSYPAWKIYDLIARSLPRNRWFDCTSPEVAITEHVNQDGSRLVVAIDHAGKMQSVTGNLAKNTMLGEVFRGKASCSANQLHLQIGGNDACVVLLRREKQRTDRESANS